MQIPLDKYNFKVTPLFDYIKEQAVQAGVYVHYNNSKQTIQLFEDREHYENGNKPIGAIQYEGSNNYSKREPHLVSFRFYRANLSNELKQALETITSYRQDTNTGPAINQEAESIAFKFQILDEDGVRYTVKKVIDVLGRQVF